MMAVTLGIHCGRDRQARLPQPKLPLKQPAIPHQGLTAAYLPALGDSTGTNWSAIALESCLFQPDKSDAHEHMQNMLCGPGAALQARLDTKLILVSRFSPWRKILQLKPGDLIVSAYAFIRSLHDKYTLAWWLGHAWYCFSDTILHAFRLTCLDFIIQFGVNLIIVICTKTSNGFAWALCVVSLSLDFFFFWRSEHTSLLAQISNMEGENPSDNHWKLVCFSLSISTACLQAACPPACVCPMT